MIAVDSALIAEIKGNPISAAPFEKTGSWARSLDASAWRKFRPAAYQLQVTALPVGSEIPNQLEWTVDKARADRLTLIGTQGEMWNAAVEKIAAKYCHLDGTRISCGELQDMLAAADGSVMSVKTIESDDAPCVWAFQTSADDMGTIMTDWGALVPLNHGMVDHGDGDWLVVDDIENIGVSGGVRTVNGNVFQITYVAVS